MGLDAGHATVSARVQNSRGTNLGDVPVEFATDVGSLNPSRVQTSSEGIAATALTATGSATVTVRAVNLTVHTLVASDRINVTPPLTPNEPSPPPPHVGDPPPSGPPIDQTPSGPLNVSLTIPDQPSDLCTGTVMSVQV